MAKKRLLTEAEAKQIATLKTEINDDLVCMSRISRNMEKLSQIFRDAGFLNTANKLEGIANGVTLSAAEVMDAFKYQVS